MSKPNGATHYRPKTDQYLKLDFGSWYVLINDNWQYTRNPFTYEMVEL